MLYADPDGVTGGMADGITGIVQFVTVVVIFIFVVGITLIATRWLANYQKGSALTGNIEVIETFRLTTNKYVQIIRVGEKYLAIAIGKDEVHVLAQLAEEEIKRAPAGQGVIPDFAGILARFRKQKPEGDSDGNNNE
ncbi:MAG: flagellar biosynthetic protein FliO [Lachnospiraceae bacterium]|jgi:flagellar protein FliO/FliZ|nr:flagellar biosynthetic protein FliO [Lachnospiraceae bacterium]